MSKWKYFIVLLFCLAIFPDIVSAESCDYNVLSRLKNYASNIKYDYSYTEQNNQVVFTARFTNISDNVILIDKTTGQTYTNVGEITVGNLQPGKSYEFTVIPSNKGLTSVIRRQNIWGQWVEYEVPTDVNENCRNTELKKIYITLPSYNPYYKLPVCEGAEEYDMCFKWQKHELSETEFIEDVTKYKEENAVKDKTKKEKEETPLMEQIVALLREYYYVPITIAIIIVIAAIYIKKKREAEEGW